MAAVALTTAACSGSVTAPTQGPLQPTGEVGGEVGDRAPEFTLKLADGTMVDQAALLAEGKPLLVYFFATW